MSSEEAQSFKLRRFPSFQGLAMRVMLSANFVAFIAKNWLMEWISVGLLLAYWVWVYCRPDRALLLTDTELLIRGDFLQRMHIARQLVEEVSPSSNGVIISCRKAGVAHYIELPGRWFDEEVWAKAYPALLAWGKQHAGDDRRA
jgi:hypothetical protein